MATKFEYYMANLKSLCDTAGLTIQEAVGKVTTNPELVMLALDSGTLPEMQDTLNLAYLFGVGLDSFFEDYGRTPSQNLIYIIGPVTGNIGFVEQFAAAQAYLESRGWHVFNPTKITAAMPSTFMTRKNFMDMGVFLAGISNAVALIPGYETHTGCLMEKAYAETNHYEIIELTQDNLSLGAQILKKEGET